MTARIRIQRNGHVTLPLELRRLAGVEEGDVLQASFRRGKIVLARTPAAIDPSQFPTADDEYTPEQRRIVDAELAKSLADIKAGRVSKTFSNPKDFIADLHKAVRRPSSRSTRRPPP
jgi:bifunctional DNA-binding transcriptional regulator/antitoxin component of YhaV-PrlF toxin-antitoxin module